MFLFLKPWAAGRRKTIAWRKLAQLAQFQPAPSHRYSSDALLHGAKKSVHGRRSSCLATHREIAVFGDWMMAPYLASALRWWLEHSSLLSFELCSSFGSHGSVDAMQPLDEL
jgi:hypothetical protein